MKKLEFKCIIEGIIESINTAKKESESLLSAGNIRSAGDSIEDLIREKISLFLPERYIVKQGHVVNSEGKVSNQFDIIIFDRLSTPKFFESNNETVFYPIESVLAIGEIKKTLRKNDLIEFGKKIKYLKVDMKRELIKNSVYGGQLSRNSSLFDIVNMRTDRKYKNPLFSFVFAIDEENIENVLIDDSNKFMPNDIYVLNYGYILYGGIESKRIISKVEDEYPEMDSWMIIEKKGVNCLATMFNNLIGHLNKCHIPPFSISNYMTKSEEFEIYGRDVRVFRTENK